MRRLEVSVACVLVGALVGCGGGYPGGFGPAELLFRDAVALSVGGEHAPNGVVVADLNGDGADDVAVVNADSGTVSVSMGRGDGHMSPRLDFTFGTGLASRNAIAAGDFDRDGILDLAVAAGDAIVILKGAGTGDAALGPTPTDFAISTTVPLGTGTGPRAIVAADLDRDGDLDLAVAAHDTGDLRVAFGAGDGTFATPAALSLQGPLPTDLDVARIDRDGYLDLVASTDNGVVCVFLATGLGGFTGPLPTLVAQGADLSAIATGDLDRDGRTDVVLVNRTARRLGVLRGRGDGSFDPFVDFDLGSGGTDVVVRDLDRDGALDAAVALDGLLVPTGSEMRPTGSVAVLLGNGDGTFQAPDFFRTEGDDSDAIAAGDLDRNGSLDLVVTNRRSDSFSTILGEPHVHAGHWYLVRYVSTGADSNPVAVAAADVNEDGRTDMIAVDPTLQRVVALLATGDAVFGPAVETALPAGTAPSALLAEDLDFDGHVDLVVLGAANVLVLQGTGTGSFTLVRTLPLPSANKPTAIALGDLNRDGRQDLLLTDTAAFSGNVSRALGLPGLWFGTFTTSALGAFRPDDLAVADLDADGDLDVAISGQNLMSGGPVLVLEGDGTGALAPPASQPPGSGSSFIEGLRLAVLDVNRDGALDLAISVAHSGVDFLLGNGDGSFRRGSSASGTGSFKELAAADLDRDGDVDLAAGVPDYGFVVTLRNFGFASFSQDLNQSAYAAAGSTAFALADWDRDGRLDIVVAAPLFDSLAVFHQY